MSLVPVAWSLHSGSLAVHTRQNGSRERTADCRLYRRTRAPNLTDSHHPIPLDVTTIDDRYDSTPNDTLRAALLTLTASQATAVEALATGATHADAAKAAGVRRETVTNCHGHHPAFRAALAAARGVLAAEQADTIRTIRRVALDLVLAKLDDSVDLATALQVLRAIPAPAEPTGTPTVPSADELLNREWEHTRRTVPPPRPASGAEAQYMELLDSVSGTAAAAEHDRIERLTLTRLADAAGVDVP